MRRLYCLLFLMLSSIAFISCKSDFGEKMKARVDESYFFETHTGRGTLAFTVEGMKVHPVTIFMNGMRDAWYRELRESDQIKIYAHLNNKTFQYIYFYFPSDELKAEAIIHPEAELDYCYKVKPYTLDEVTINDVTIFITYCENNIISGRFTLDGEYADSTGKVHIVDITDGIFDLKHD